MNRSYACISCFYGALTPTVTAKARYSTRAFIAIGYVFLLQTTHSSKRHPTIIEPMVHLNYQIIDVHEGASHELPYQISLHSAP